MDLLIGQAKTRLSLLCRGLAKGENPFGEGVRARVASRGSSRQIHERSIYRLYQSLSKWNNSKLPAVLVKTVSLISATPHFPPMGTSYRKRSILTVRNIYGKIQPLRWNGIREYRYNAFPADSDLIKLFRDFNTWYLSADTRCFPFSHTTIPFSRYLSEL